MAQFDLNAASSFLESFLSEKERLAKEKKINTLLKDGTHDVETTFNPATGQMIYHLKTKDPGSEELKRQLQQGQLARSQLDVYQAGGPAPSMFGGMNPQAQPMAQAQLPTAQPTAQGLPGTLPAPGQYAAEELDAFGRPKSFKLQKLSSAQEKRDVENTELAGQQKNLLGLFNKARAEATATPGFGQPGLGGRLANLQAIIKGKLGDSPAINVFQDRIAAYATTAAKSAGEVRPTDADIVRFSRALTNLKSTDLENALQLELTLKDIAAKGQSVSWAQPFVDEFEQLTGTNVDFDFGGGGAVMPSQNQAQGQMQQFSSEQEAEAANLPPGTIIMINGRKARID